MTTPLTTLVEIAVKNGYDKDKAMYPIVTPDSDVDSGMAEIMTQILYRDTVIPRLLLDPEFFKSLGRGMGWGITTSAICTHCGRIYTCDTPEAIYRWKVEMHRLIDTLSEGKSASDWAESIIETSKIKNAT